MRKKIKIAIAIVMSVVALWGAAQRPHHPDLH